MEKNQGGRKRNNHFSIEQNQMAESFCFDESLVSGLSIAHFSTLRNTNIVLKSIKVSIYCSKMTLGKGCPGITFDVGMTSY